MHSYEVGFSEEIINLSCALKWNLKQYNTDNIKWKLTNDKFYTIKIIDEEIDKEICDNFICDAIYGVFLNDILEIELSNFINKRLPDENIIDRTNLYCQTWKSFLRFNMWKKKLRKEIMESINRNGPIILDGILNFRLKCIKEKWEEITARNYDKYIIEKEYNEFINLLKLFVQLQQPKLNEVHIFISEIGEYSIRDKSNMKLDTMFLMPIKIRATELDLSNEDMLISALITISPLKIVIHDINNAKLPQIVDTIKKVFGERVNTV